MNGARAGRWWPTWEDWEEKDRIWKKLPMSTLLQGSSTWSDPYPKFCWARSGPHSPLFLFQPLKMAWHKPLFPPSLCCLRESHTGKSISEWLKNGLSSELCPPTHQGVSLDRWPYEIFSPLPSTRLLSSWLTQPRLRQRTPKLNGGAATAVTWLPVTEGTGLGDPENPFQFCAPMTWAILSSMGYIAVAFMNAYILHSGLQSASHTHAPR